MSGSISPPMPTLAERQEDLDLVRRIHDRIGKDKLVIPRAKNVHVSIYDKPGKVYPFNVDLDVIARDWT